jgi:tRNA pseudouridine55 synthase
MVRHKKGDKVDGWVCLDKPEGMTSTQALGKVRWLLNAQKAGHGGTLDPLATGILPIALGEATKTIPYCQDHLKTYSFTLVWGEERSTDDAEGEVTVTSPARPPEGAIRTVLAKFTGEIDQTPPKFSAIKVNGQRAYDLAREGEEVELTSRVVYIENLELLETLPGSARFRCLCGKGTYMRSLGRDIARELGAAGYITGLRRESVGPFTLENAISLAKLEETGHSVVLPVETVLGDIPALALNEREAAQLKSGQCLSFIARPDMDRLHRVGIDTGHMATALAFCNGKPIALVDVDGVEVRARRVLNL